MDRLISRLDKALNQQKSITLIFDIDSTIFDVTPRNQEILNLFLHTKEDIRKNYTLKAFDWGIERFLKDIDSEKIKKHAKLFWSRHFFSGTFLNSDRPYPMAIESIKGLKDLGCEILYLTGRDSYRMREGTLKQLKHWKLPLNSDKDLITKPDKTLKDGPYKSEAIEKIIKTKSKKTEFLFFDNEPVVIDHCQFLDFENYEAFFIESTHSNRMSPKSSWSKISVESYPQIFEYTLSKGAC
jgi:hypothetical protein